MSVRILIVDDHTDTAEVTAMLFRAEGYEVMTAADGAQALAVLQNERFDLMLIDMAMPKMNGVDLARAIRQVFSPIELPMVGMTAVASEATRAAMLKAGMAEVLFKPYDIKELKQVIARSLKPH